MVNDICQQVGQPREENFKLGIKDQAGEIGMTHTQLKRLWSGLKRGYRVKAGRRRLENRVEERS